MKVLMVFDFDHTVVDDNSDTWVVRSLPDQKLPESVSSSYRKGRWTEFMGRVLSYIGEQNVGPERLRAVMETIPLTAGMTELLRFISERDDAHCIVVSDSNSVFIDWVLQASGLHGAVDQVFTNPAAVNPSGTVQVQPHHSHRCHRCPVNLCKATVLERYLAERRQAGVHYRRVLYVGDGGNDLCPTLSLGEGDVVMPRRGYMLEKLLLGQQSPRENLSVRARVAAWSSGTEILEELKASLQS